jgi:hypothetical protein
MAQIVINISDGTYNRCKNERVGLLPFDIPEVCDAIKNGTPLPKGHGRLIDADAYAKKYNTNINGRIGDEYIIAPTIIEADKKER